MATVATVLNQMEDLKAEEGKIEFTEGALDDLGHDVHFVVERIFRWVPDFARADGPTGIDFSYRGTVTRGVVLHWKMRYGIDRDD